MEIRDPTRHFKYNSVTLADPNSSLAPEQVKEFYATQYPELLNAVVEGPVSKQGVLAYTFLRAAGAKGSGGAAAVAAKAASQVLQDALRLEPNVGAQLAGQALEGQQLEAALRLAQVVRSQGRSLPLTVPAKAHGLWG